MEEPLNPQPNPKPAPRNPRHKRSLPVRRSRTGMWIVVAMVVVMAYFGIVPRLHATQKLDNEIKAEKAALPLVDVRTASMETSSGLTLPSSIQAIEETSISARTSGYLSQRFVDIGSKVKAGQVLATIDAPEVDQELSQAQADASKSVAGGQQATADVARLEASVAQARAAQTGAESNLEEIRADLKHAQAKLIEAQGAEAVAEAHLSEAKKIRDEKDADVGRARARLTLASKTYARWQLLAKGGAVSGQDLDEAQEGYESSQSGLDAAKADLASADADVLAAQSNLAASKGDVRAAMADVSSGSEKVQAAKSAVVSSAANVAASLAALKAGSANVKAADAAISASEANVGRFTSLKSFERVIAPFDGVITARNVDVGDLISPPQGGTSTSDQTNPVSKTGLFSISRDDVLRVLVYVPEAYVPQIFSGQPAEISVAELPGQWFPGNVFHLSGAVDATSRTELVEIRVPNRKNELKPGMYAQVHFEQMRGTSTVEIPATAMIFDAQGTRVAQVRPDDTIHFITVQLGRDFGDKIEVLVGLKGNEKIVNNPDPSLIEGEKVRVSTGSQL